MKTLLTTLCLTIALLLGNVLFGNVAIATDYLSAQFGNVTLKLPTPENLCLIGNSESERAMLDYTRQTQSKSKNKLLSLWIDCDTQKKFQNGIPSELEEWVILSAYVTGNPPREKTYPRTTKKVFLKKMLGTNEPDFGLIQKKVNKNLSKINENLLGDKNAILLGKPLNLGVLAVTDSIHKGVIMPVNSDLIVGILGSTILKGVIINFFYYQGYIDKDSIKETLLKSKIFSAFLHNLN